MRTLPQIRQYVWDFLDVEDCDIPASIIDAWAAEAWHKILKITRRHPHFEHRWDFALIADQPEWPEAADLEDIEWIRADGRVLTNIGQRDAVLRFSSMDGQIPTGAPTHYSRWDDKVLFWPVPSGEFNVTVFGYRKPADWVENGGVPDMPAHFESTLLSFVLYRAYGQQQMTEEAQQELAEFNSQMSEFGGWELEAPGDRPLILGGSKRPFGGPQPLTFPIRMG